MATRDATFERKKKRALKIMEEKGMGSSNYAPPFHRLLWKLGVNIPPPPFALFWINVFSFAAMYAPTWGILMWFTVWRNQCTGLAYALITALVTGLFFGFGMAMLYRWRKKVNQLPEWSQL